MPPGIVGLAVWEQWIRLEQALVPMRGSMFRRILSLLLLPCVVLTQSGAAFGHTHSDDEPAGHGLCQHLHSSLGSADHDLGDHHHNPGDPCVLHHHDAEDTAEKDSQRGNHPDPLSEHEHDSDAIYVKIVDSVVRPRATISDLLAASLLWVSNGPQALAAVSVSPPHQAVDPTHRPPPCGYDCPLYIWQLALLI